VAAALIVWAVRRSDRSEPVTQEVAERVTADMVATD
jgi:hypothetical protein